jgi:FemAB-related protein (PEP-CTERM system-associated)
MSLVCKLLDTAAEPAWDAFVESHDACTFFHKSSWRHIIQRAFSHQPFYLYAERDGAITGILPLCLVTSNLFGRSLCSLPFCVYAGPVFEDAESYALLEAEATKLMRRCNVKILEFRCLDKLTNDFVTQDSLYVTFRKRILPDETANLNAVPRKQRAVIRKGIKAGLTSLLCQDIGLFYSIYAQSVRNLGTPVFHRNYFNIIMEYFADCCDITVVFDGDTPLAAVLSFYFRDQVLPYYGGGTAAARTRSANDFMYWEVMRRATARQLAWFDFGRSKIGTGSHAFKVNWGFSPTPLFYQYKLTQGATIPQHNPLNPRYRLLIGAWKKLPLPVANFVGPMIVRGIG